jgi:hypothetical protein
MVLTVPVTPASTQVDFTPGSHLSQANWQAVAQADIGFVPLPDSPIAMVREQRLSPNWARQPVEARGVADDNNLEIL